MGPQSTILGILSLIFTWVIGVALCLCKTPCATWVSGWSLYWLLRYYQIQNFQKLTTKSHQSQIIQGAMEWVMALGGHFLDFEIIAWRYTNGSTLIYIYVCIYKVHRNLTKKRLSRHFLYRVSQKITFSISYYKQLRVLEPIALYSFFFWRPIIWKHLNKDILQTNHHLFLGQPEYIVFISQRNYSCVL